MARRRETQHRSTYFLSWPNHIWNDFTTMISFRKFRRKIKILFETGWTRIGQQRETNDRKHARPRSPHSTRRPEISIRPPSRRIWSAVIREGAGGSAIIDGSIGRAACRTQIIVWFYFFTTSILRQWRFWLDSPRKIYFSSPNRVRSFKSHVSTNRLRSSSSCAVEDRR